MDLAWDLGALAVAGLALWHAYGVGMEMFIAWYSGVDPAMTTARWLQATAHLAVALGVAAAALCWI